MSQLVQSILHTLQSYSIFENYYTSVVRGGRPGVPTADEARRDLEQRYRSIVRLGGL